MIKALGVLGAVLGFFVMRSARRGDGLGSALFFVLGLALFVIGIYFLFFEDGRGAARWLPFLEG